MLIKPGLAVSQMSGTMGGVVASHNRFGQYFRRWTKPTDPNTPSQAIMRAIMATCIADWRALSTAAKESWDNYAANTPWLNKLGETVYLNGIQHYLRLDIFTRKVQGELGVPGSAVPACGSTGGLPAGVQGAVVTVGVAAGLSLAYDDADDWCAEDGAVMVVYMSRPRPASQVYGNGPYRYCVLQAGSSVDPAVSPLVMATVSLPFAIAEGDRVDYEIRLVRADVTLSTAIKVSAVVGA